MSVTSQLPDPVARSARAEPLTVAEVRLLLTEPRTLGNVADVIRRLMKCDACVVWKPSRTVGQLADAPPQGRLYPYSSTFAPGYNAQHAGIPMDLVHDTTGRFYTTNQDYTFENDFPTTDTESPSSEFMEQLQLKRVSVARFSMIDSDTTDYVVSVYRKGDQPAFDLFEGERLWHIAWFLPTLYRRMVDSELKEAITNVNELLRANCETVDQATQQLALLCHQLAASFHCHEVTIYMRALYEATGVYTLLASTLDCSKLKSSCSSDKTAGVTSYVLATGSPIWFHDLQNFKDPVRYLLIQKLYPGIQWHDSARLGNDAKQILGLPSDAPTPPLPFVAVPIFGNDGQVLGVMRACLGKDPFYFIGDEIQAFGLIAKEVGRWWESMVHGHQHAKRADIWQALNRTLREQHDILSHASSDEPDVSDLLAGHAVDSIAREQSFGIVAFRRGADPSQLHVLKTRSNMSDQGGNALQSPGPGIVPFGGVLNAAGPNRGFNVAPLVRTIRQVREGTSNEEIQLFTQVQLVISLVITVESRLYGILDVGFRDERDYHVAEEHINQYLELVARQLALFERVRIGVEATQAAKRNELKTYRAVTHQLRSPLLSATRLAPHLLDVFGGDKDPRGRILAPLAGMIRKAYSVTNTIDMLGRLFSGDPIRADLEPVTADKVRKLAFEVATNNRYLAEKQMRLEFVVEPQPTWEDPNRQYTYAWNRELAENSLDAVLSNAFKYSNPGETIQIVGDATSTGLSVKVVSRGGIILRPEHVDKCTEYEWRSDEARKRGGAGIGLWLTKHYMELQRGSLRAFPTTASGETVFELVFARRSLSS